jgi:hypothetical protein
VTIFHGLANNESLYISTEYCRDENYSERVSIGWIDEDIQKQDGTISMQIVWFTKKNCEVLQACLNEIEIDLVIDGLRKAKEHMQEIKSKTESEPA